MGMYTELVLAAKIKNDAEAIDILNYMLGNTEIEPKLPQHALFKTERWTFMLRTESAYFDGITHSELRREVYYDNETVYFLTVRTNLKNYGSEIEHFLDWLNPYIETRGFLGYTRYEECADPTLIYKNNESIYMGAIAFDAGGEHK